MPLYLKLFTRSLKIFANGRTELNQFCNYTPTRSGNHKDRREEPKNYKLPDFDGNFQNPIETSTSKITILNQFAPHSGENHE